ncbi:hypothetical protein THTE_1494 [Thermogutta terrifontis]|uniref:Uncharacterized protein n=1 Tax=Thermogutta terrifontis TaxID=1331910 RepID=A0A286RDQ8_9BACT|nr:hypothetical protein THTE_1494 [Thermogutta terrifontis]
MHRFDRNWRQLIRIIVVSSVFERVGYKFPDRLHNFQK